MNNKGQAVFFTLMLAAVVILLALAFANPLKESVVTARNVTTGDLIGMDCDNSSISDFNKAPCVITDLTLPYFVGFLLALAGGIIGARILFT